MLVGEAPGAEEERKGEPFVGASGHLLNEMLHDAGLTRSGAFVTNVSRERPPGNDIEEWIHSKKRPPIGAHWVQFRDKWIDRRIMDGIDLLRKEIELVQPNVIVPVGNLAMWALTGKWGITDWRGSLLSCDLVPGPHVVPTYHPAAVLRQWSWRAIAVHDLRRARDRMSSREYSPPQYHFMVRPTADDVFSTIEALLTMCRAGPLTLSVDIETRAGHIACVGFAWSKLAALCIPFMCAENLDGFWNAETETQIVWKLRELLTHPNVEVVGQNFLYDAQYFYRHWHFVPRFKRDTMLGHHVLFAGMPKGLDFLSSMYCAHHVYWKGEGKEWHYQLGEDQLWIYNCKDCVITYECDEEIQKATVKAGLAEVGAFQQSLFEPTLQTMNRGIRVDLKRRSNFALELSSEIATREQFYIDVLGHPLNVRSSLQMKKLFYEDLQQKPIFNRKTGAITLNDEAIQKIADREPLLRPLVKGISEHRSLGVFLSTFVNAPLDHDSRIRCSFNPAGTETFRYSSSENAFGSGLNLQNIPKGGSTAKDDPTALSLPNVRKIFVPDPGYTFFDVDLDRADLQVVVWEAEDDELKEVLRKGIDMHCYSACGIYGIKGIPMEELADKHPNYKDHRARIGESRRQKAKGGVHAVDYYCQARTLAAALGLTVHEAQRFIDAWLGAHPGIRRWHERIEAQLKTTRTVTNKFGYHRVYFDRIDAVLPEALAWIPQSTVACVINRAWRRIYDRLPEVQVLIQVHDSLAGQYPTHLGDWAKNAICENARIMIPYSDVLEIPVGIKTSTESWGACE